MKTAGTILLCVVASTVAFAGIAVLGVAVQPSYKATGLIQVRMPEPALAPAAPFVPAEAVERLKITYAQRARTESVLQATVDDSRVKGTKWYRDNVQDPIAALEMNTDASPVPDSMLIQFTVTGLDPTEIADICNAWSDAFVHAVVAASNSKSDSDIRRIEMAQSSRILEREDMVKKINTLPYNDEKAIRQYLAILLQELQAMGTRRMEGELALANIERQRKGLEEAGANGLPDSHPRVRDELNNDHLLRILEQELITLELSQGTRAGSGRGSGATQPGAPDRVETLKNRIADRQAELRRSATIQLASDLAEQAHTMTAMMAAVAVRTDQLKDESKVPNDCLYKITDLLGRRRAADTEIEVMARQLLELRIQRQSSSVYVVQPAVKPRQPTSPRWGAMLPAGAGVGLVAGVALALVSGLRTRAKRTAAAHPTLLSEGQAQQ